MQAHDTFQKVKQTYILSQSNVSLATANLRRSDQDDGKQIKFTDLCAAMDWLNLIIHSRTSRIFKCIFKCVRKCTKLQQWNDMDAVF
jgi:hypothetical protein